MTVFSLVSFPKDDYRQVSLISAGFTFVAFFVLLPVPESPTWLVAKSQITKAQKALSSLRGYGEKNEKIQLNFLYQQTFFRR